MASALGPVDVLCRLLTTVYFSLSSFLYITVIWSPLLYGLHVASNGVNCSNGFEIPQITDSVPAGSIQSRARPNRLRKSNHVIRSLQSSPRFGQAAVLLQPLSPSFFILFRSLSFSLSVASYSIFVRVYTPSEPLQ